MELTKEELILLANALAVANVQVKDAKRAGELLDKMVNHIQSLPDEVAATQPEEPSQEKEHGKKV